MTINVTFHAFNVTLLLPSVHGWIIWQQRIDENVTFNRLWADYRDGFGVISQTTDYWLGLKYVNALTAGGPGGPGSWKLRVEMQALGTNLWYKTINFKENMFISNR